MLLQRGGLQEEIAPSVNLTRKWFHTSMASVRAAQTSLQSIFQRLDGHSGAVQERHYILKTALEDARLCKALVESMFQAPPVAWPSDDELPDEELNRLIDSMPAITDAEE